MLKEFLEEKPHQYAPVPPFMINSKLNSEVLRGIGTNKRSSKYITQVIKRHALGVWKKTM